MKILTLIFIGFLSLVNSANILSVFPIPSKSHDILGSALSKHLSSLGHNVTYVSGFSHKKAENFNPIHLDEMDSFRERFQKDMNRKQTVLEMFEKLFQFGEFSKIVYEDEDVQLLIKSDSKFDVMIGFVGVDASVGLAHRFNVPLILFIPLSPLPFHNSVLANPAPPSYVPTIATPYSDDMTFFERVSNTVIPFVFFSAIHAVIKYFGNQALNTYLPGYPTMQEIIDERVDLMLINTHISTESPRPSVPNVIQIGGFHLQKPEPLTEELQQVLDAAKDGFVYFSFGTNVKVKKLPRKVVEVFKKALGKLPFKIIMKYEDDTMNDQPDNFYVRKWFPQPSVLAHPNAKLFISHGGYGGTTESLYYGVPLVCIPFFGDQSKNCADAEKNGYSITIDLDKIDEETFSDALQKVLYNETFKEAVRFKSELYRDQPMNPMDKAVYWIEHVIKHKGAKHLKVKGAQLPWWQYYLIDVFLFLGFVISLVLSLCFYICKLAFNRICGKTSSRKSKIKTN